MSVLPPLPIKPTQRVCMFVNGQQFSTWMRVKIKRSLSEICGSFELEYLDQGREAATLTTLIEPPPFFKALNSGQMVRITIDGETVLIGYIGKVKVKATATEMSAFVSGRDICGDLVDCAASPQGPCEWKNVTLAMLATNICKPFGIGVLVQTDTGAAFPVMSISPHEKALPTIEKAARQRAVLITSDGVANLVLTTAGSTRAPDGITLGDNVIDADFEDDWDKRFSDIWVKGQTARANGNHGVPCALNPALAPSGTGTGPAPSATQAEAAGIVMTGYAKDPEITRYRPDVRMVNTQSGSSSVQEQAEWHVRIDRGQSRKAHYTVLDWRAGADSALWRPNQLTAVYDPYAGIDDDMLIDGVEYLFDEGGSRTQLSTVGKTAFDRINEPSRKRPRHQHQQQALKDSL